MKEYKIWIARAVSAGSPYHYQEPVILRGSNVSVAAKRALSGWVEARNHDNSVDGGKPIEMGIGTTLTMTVERIG